jgi:hypothetical protein
VTLLHDPELRGGHAGDARFVDDEMLVVRSSVVLDDDAPAEDPTTAPSAAPTPAAAPAAPPAPAVAAGSVEEMVDALVASMEGLFAEPAAEAPAAPAVGPAAVEPAAAPPRRIPGFGTLFPLAAAPEAPAAKPVAAVAPAEVAPESFVAAESLAAAEPIVEVEPAIEAAPVVEAPAEPAIEAGPAVAVEAVVEAEPVAAAEPAVASGPTVEAPAKRKRKPRAKRVVADTPRHVEETAPSVPAEMAADATPLFETPAPAPAEHDDALKARVISLEEIRMAVTPTEDLGAAAPAPEAPAAPAAEPAAEAPAETPAVVEEPVDEDRVDRLVARFRGSVAAPAEAPAADAEEAPAPAPAPAPVPAAVGDDAMFEEAVKAVKERGRGSVVVLQRRLGIGFTRATKLLDMLVARGVVGPENESGSHPLL